MRTKILLCLLMLSSCHQGSKSADTTKNPIVAQTGTTPDSVPEAIKNEIIEKSFQQRIDHFDKKSKMFNQRLWISKSFAKSSDAPTLVLLCAEHVCGESYITDYLDKLALPTGANQVAIEHRYYGKSQPFADLSTKSLKYLQVKQALADTALILKYLRKSEKLSGPFIVIGLSYGGDLAAKMRVAYPSLVDGAWSSSGQTKYIPDYQAYDINMTQTMGASCAQSLRDVTAKIENIVDNDPEQFKLLREKYFVPNMTHKADFLFGLVDVAAAAVQYNEASVLCDVFKGGDIIEEFGSFVKRIHDEWPYKMDSYGFGAFSDISSSGPNASIRAFFYQQCSELGLFQTAAKDKALSVRSARLDLNYMIDGCERMFGRKFDLAKISENYNKIYHNRLIQENGPSNIYFVSGDLDPFMSASINPTTGNITNKNIVAVSIKDGAHCSELSKYVDEKSPQSFKDAKAQGIELIKKWVSEVKK